MFPPAAVANIFSPMSKYLTIALLGIGTGVERGTDVGLETHE